ncbi:MAG: PGF-CTERM sorting domain-containing protein, partial [Haloarculaceae archaeon]
MRRETALAGGVVVLLVAMLLALTLVPGALEQPESDVRPSQLDLRPDSPIAVQSVRGETVTLRLDSRLAHRGGPAENVTVEVRAIDAETGLLADSVTTDVGDIEGDREVSVPTNITVERAGGYRLETIVYEDGERVTSGRRTISGVGTLTPEYARSSVQFQRFDTQGADLPTITYAIENVSDGRTTMRVSTYLTNTGDESAGDVTLLVRARQADSNVIADTTTVRTGTIRPGRTITQEVELSVPDGYNYWLDAILMKDGVVVGTASEPANLDPTETLTKNQTREEVNFSSGDFEPGDDRPDREPQATGTPG